MDVRLWVAVPALLLFPGVASAAPPKIVVGPVVLGFPQVGADLVASASWTGDPAPTAAWAWLRCPKASGACDPITGATSPRYRPVAADLGQYLRVRLRVTNTEGTAEARSNPTGVIGPAPTPTPSPTPTPTPTPSATPTPTAVPTVSPTPVPPAATPVPVSATPATPAAVPRLMNPFPVVRIKGLFTPNGVRITVLSVTAPRGSRIQVDCTGRSCPTKRYRTSTKGTTRLRRFERSLRTGTKLEVSVLREGTIGKYTQFVIRRGREPRRTDRCLDPRESRPVACASS